MPFTSSFNKKDSSTELSYKSVLSGKMLMAKSQLPIAK
jgi:hypothetical protein